MDSFSKNMDYLTRHWAAFPRRFPFPAPLLSSGDIKEKDHWIRRSFSTCNFSLILRGRGEFHRQGKLWPVEAPCVITQWPREPLSYGPLVPEETWDEIYLIYDARSFPWFVKCGLIDRARPVWPILNPEAVTAHIEELRALTASRTPHAVVDQLDRACERLLLETLLPPADAVSDSRDEVVQRIVSQMRQRPGEAYDFKVLARRHGISASTLRRRWTEALRVGPGRYLLNLRVEKARRLLVETTLQVGEIARQTGFDDVLYFSRRFRLEMGTTPSEYRRRYRIKPR